jgi:uncharacterized membrane protein
LDVEEHMKFFSLRWLAPGLIALIASAGITTSAVGMQRHVKLCNKSNIDFEVAVGYDRSGTSETTSQGWFTVKSCRCETLFNADVRASEFFYYVTRQGSSPTDALSSGKGPLCVKGAGFKLVAQNKSKAACNKAGGHWVNFTFANATSETFTVNYRHGNSVCQ